MGTPPSTPPIDTYNKFPSDSPFTFGSTDETGIAVDTYDQNDQVDTFEQKDSIGNTIEVICHNMRSEITLSGEIESTMASIVGQAWTFTNLIMQQYGTTPPSTGVTIVKGVAYSKGRAKNMSVRVTATYYPLVGEGATAAMHERQEQRRQDAEPQLKAQTPPDQQ